MPNTKLIYSVSQINVIVKTTNFRTKIWENLCDIGRGKDFLCRTEKSINYKINN